MGLFKVATPVILAASLLSSLAQAAPAPRAIKVRDYVTDLVTETIWTTLDITTTVYVDELPSTTAPASTPAEVTSSAEEVESTPLPTPTAAATSAPAPAPEPVSSQPAPSAGEFVESSTAPAPEYNTPAPEVPAYTPPAPAPPAPATPEAPAPSPEPVSEATNTAASSGGSESATCEGGSSSCKGDVTHWDGGLGACGTVVDTEGDMAIALPHEFMGTLSNSNPYCGKTVTIKTVSGSTVQATVKDKCMGCVGRSIDLTNKLFNAVTDGKGDGRVQGIEWWISE
jgi:hypothetical protein